MKNIARFSVLTLSLLASLASVNAHAAGAGTTELKVTGIIKPAACTPNLTGGGTVDYGTIAASTLKPDVPNVLPAKTVAFNVVCDSPIKLSVRAIDNRKSSMIPGLAASLGNGSGDQYAYGLGTAGNKNIGIYSVSLVQGTFTADGTSPDTLTDDTSNGGTWTKSTGGRFNSNGTERKSFATSGSIVPGAYKTVTGTLGVQAVIDKSSNLSLATDLTLDGSATIEVMYL